MFYFDYAASAPPFPEALEEFSRISKSFFANPSSAHASGDAARQVLRHSRERLAACVQAGNSRFILTSGGTEANNLVLHGVMSRYPKGRLLVAADVHDSVWFACARYPHRVDVVPLGPDGRLAPQRLRQAISRDTVLFSAVHACSELGTVHDIATYAAVCHQHGIRFHCDGVQAAGHVQINIEHGRVDYYTISAHKFGGPRGVGGLFARNDDLAPQLFGGRQERGMRAGTENVAGLAAAAVALEQCSATLSEDAARLRELAATFVLRLREDLKDFHLNSSKEGLPGLVSISFQGTTAANLVAELSLRGFAISAGSACHADSVQPSRIVRAFGRSEAEALGTVRISMGRDSDESAVFGLAGTLADVVEKQRELA